MSLCYPQILLRHLSKNPIKNTSTMRQWNQKCKNANLLFRAHYCSTLLHKHLFLVSVGLCWSASFKLFLLCSLSFRAFLVSQVKVYILIKFMLSFVFPLLCFSLALVSVTVSVAPASRQRDLSQKQYLSIRS